MEFSFGNIAAIVTAATGFVSGLWAVRKVTAESESVVVTTAEKVVALVHGELESSEEKRRLDLEKYDHDRQQWAKEREELRQTVEGHEHRIRKLEWWILHNTDTHPSDIIGSPF